MPTALVLYIREPLIFAAVSKQSGGHMFPHACSTGTFICSVFLACDYGAVVLHVAEQSSLERPCARVRGMEKWNTGKWNKINARWGRWADFDSKQLRLFPKGLSGHLESALMGVWKEFHRMFNRKKPGNLWLFTFFYNSEGGSTVQKAA